MTPIVGLLALLLGADPRGATAGISPRGGGRAAAAAAKSTEEAPRPAADDRDRERILRLQASLRDIVHDAFGRLKVGLRVIEAHTGRVFFGRGTNALMDPASNQKVLATTTALVRLGNAWRFRTEVYGVAPDADGVVRGDLFLRGSGDPSLSAREMEELANKLVGRGVTRVTGGVIADPRRFGDDRPSPGNDRTTQIAIDRGIVGVRVRPGDTGEPPLVSLDPALPGDPSGATAGFVVVNRARTVEGRQRRLTIDVTAVKGVLRVEVAGRIGADNPGVLFRHSVADGALTAAIFFRAALAGVGVSVRERAAVGPLSPETELLATHSSAPLSLLLRKINKDSDNYEAERLLLAVGAEVLGGPPTTEKGIAVLRDVIGEFGLDPRSYVPKNGSGLGHANRISALAMTELLRAIYLDPRVGPELVQSLSVGGVDGTTRNRFRGTPVARHVRAKTGTLDGKSVLSGLVGDGEDVMAFSIMVQGFKTRSALTAVRGAQVAAVNTMMRYIQERGGVRVETPATFEPEVPAGPDYETGGDVEIENDLPSDTPPAVSERRTTPPVETRPRANAAPRRLAARAPENALAAPVDVHAEGNPQSPSPSEDDDETEAADDVARPSPFSSAHVGVGGAGSIAGGDAAPGARLFMDLGGTGLGLETAFYGTTYHAVAGPGTGSSEWTRLAGAIGPRYRVSGKSFALDVKAALAAGWFWVHGHNYTMNSSARSWSLGAGLGARLSWERRGLSPWLGLDAIGWPGRHAIEVVGVTETRAIPAVDLLLSLGVSFRLW